ncbi:MAG: nitrate reductase molybdenum cofactor assembly chaperone [Gammaproteobacteria bacterium]|nr:nitrate reductase molybdenum cofactor assembly chaperone [Gammaproteobacteria bacterium]
MLMLRVMAALLEYPQAELLEALPEMRQVILEDVDVTPVDRGVLNAFFDHFSATPLLDMQAAYVQTFDLVPEHSLHLTHHLFGDENGRGPALIDLTEYYKSFGFEPVADELPDYLPLVLEFAAQLDVDEGRVFLSRITKVLTQLAINLETAESVYAPLIRVLERQTHLAPMLADI